VPRALGARAGLRAPRGPEPRRPEILLPRRADHREQPDGRPSRLGPHLQGRDPALPGAMRPRAALPERLRLPGTMGGSRGREGAGLQLQAGDRSLRAGPLRPRLPRASCPLRGRPDGAVQAAGPVDGLGQLVLHDVRHEHRVQLGLPVAVPRARLALPGASPDAVVSAVRHLHLAARAAGRLR
jgi:hypothetical protein